MTVDGYGDNDFDLGRGSIGLGCLAEAEGEARGQMSEVRGQKRDRMDLA